MADIYCASRVTQRLLDDSSIDFAAWLSGKIADKFASRGDGLREC